MKGPVLAVLILTSLFCACSKPDTEEYFIQAKDATDSLYSYTFDFTDSLSSYSLFFFSRTDRISFHKKKTEPVRLEIEWRSEEGDVGIYERVFLNPSLSKQSKKLYRSGVRPQNGFWKINVKVSGAPEGWCGLGLMSVRENGTR